MKLFRCYNPTCADKPGLPGHDFTGEKAKCDRCGTTADHPRFGHMIVQLKLIHWEPPSHVEGVGVGHPACQPAPEKETGVRGAFKTSGAPDAVNCPACRETEAFQAALNAQRFDPTDDIPLEVDLEAGMFRKSEKTA